MLITASTASLAYILTQLQKQIWNDLIYLSIISLILLALSFVMGCCFLSNQAKLINVNSQLLQPEYYNSHSTELFQKLDTTMKTSSRTSNAQFWLFITGAVLYAVYVLLEIYFKTQSI